MSFSSILKSFMVGAAAGTVLGALYSPKIRGAASKIGGAAKSKISESTNQIIDELTEKIDEGKKALVNLKRKMPVASKGISHHRRNGNHSKRKISARAARS